MTQPLGIGPYTSEGPDWWVPVAAASYLTARREVKSCMFEPGNRLVYRGRVMARLDDEHEWGDDCPGDGCANAVLAYHFEEVDR